MSYDFKRIIDYKTGGKKKEFQYKEDKYTQLALYALALRQEKGFTPDSAQVVFMRRDGNAFKGEELSLASEQPIIMDIDISTERLLQVYDETLIIAKEIEKFYTNF